MAEPIVSTHINISGDSASVENASKRARDSLSRFERQAQSTAQGVTAALRGMAATFAGMFAVDRLVNFGAQVLSTAADLRRFSDQAGLSTTQFQELQFALRNAGVTGEQLAVAFATFSRNLSDLQRGTGPLLDFLRQSAPQFIDQFNRVQNVSEGFELLARILARAGNAHDALRFAQAAGGEQMGRAAIEAARLGPRLDELRRAAHDAGRVWSEQQVSDLHKAQQAWKDFADGVVLQTGRVLGAMAQAGRQNEIQITVNAIRDVNRALTAAAIAGNDTSIIVKRLGELWADYARLTNLASTATSTLGAQIRNLAVTVAQGGDFWTLQNNAVREANAQLQLLMARFQVLPPAVVAATEATRAFQETWTQTQRVLANQSATQGEQDLARLNLMHQIDGERTRILGGQLGYEEEIARRRSELHRAHELELISETERQGALMAMEAKRAQVYLSAAGSILGSMSQIFQKQKGWAYAAAVVNTAAAVAGALAQPPYWPWNAPQVAAAVASGAAQIAAISRQQIGTSGSVPSVGGGVAADAGPQIAPQLLTINLQGDNFSRATVEGFLEQMAGVMADGGGQSVIKVIKGM